MQLASGRSMDSESPINITQSSRECPRRRRARLWLTVGSEPVMWTRGSSVLSSASSALCGSGRDGRSPRIDDERHAQWAVIGGVLVVIGLRCSCGRGDP